jgi:hypothetical protein
MKNKERDLMGAELFRLIFFVDFSLLVNTLAVQTYSEGDQHVNDARGGRNHSIPHELDHQGRCLCRLARNGH